MEYFLELFGGITIKDVAFLIMAIIFLYGCYKRVKQYFSDKAVKDKEKDDQLQEVIDQAKKYPEWHQQSLDIRLELSTSISSLSEKIDALSNNIKLIEKKNDVNRITTCRYRILRFDDEIRHNDKHSREHFDQVIDDINEYEIYCVQHPDYKNNKAMMAIENIKDVYENRPDMFL